MHTPILVPRHLRNSPHHAGFRIAVAIVMLLNIVLAGCGTTPTRVSPGDQAQPGPAKGSLSEAAQRLTGMRVDAFLYRIIDKIQLDITEPRVISCIKKWLAAAEPVAAPSLRYHRDVLFRFGDQWGKEPTDVWFDDIGSGNPAYIQWEGSWYGLSGDLTAFLQGLDSYEVGAWAVDPADEALLSKYGYTPAYLMSKVREWLPERLIHRPGEFPTTIFWAIANELCGDVGLDLTPYLGENVDVSIYKIAGTMPESFRPQQAYGRALVVRLGDKIIGAWIDVGGYSSMECSLKGRTLPDIVGKSLDEWMACVIDPTDPLEQRLTQLSPEDVIRTYYAAINDHDYQLAHACESRVSLMNYIAYNRDHNALYRHGYEDDTDSGLANITSAKVLKVERFVWPDDPYPQYQTYQVTVDIQYRKPITSDSGVTTPNADMKRETEQTGWRIYGIGFGR